MGIVYEHYDGLSKDDYNAKLNSEVKNIMGEKKSISSKKLKKMSLFADAYKQLSTEGKQNFDAILNFDGNAKKVNEEELRTLLRVLDAESAACYDHKWSGYRIYDTKFSLGEKGEINRPDLTTKFWLKREYKLANPSDDKTNE